MVAASNKVVAARLAKALPPWGRDGRKHVAWQQGRYAYQRMIAAVSAGGLQRTFRERMYKWYQTSH
jgi:hypothetical protein